MPLQIPHEFLRGLTKAGLGLWWHGVLEAPTVELQQRYVQLQLELWASIVGASPQAAAGPAPGDRRFRADDWRDNAWHAWLVRQYLLNAQWLADMAETADLPPRAKHKLRFFTRQVVDAASPANLALTNPEVLRLALESKGDSLRSGWENLLGDLRRGRITITDEGAFEVGRDVAISDGAVVFENPLFQLIQYAPRSESVARRPLLIVPPCINKFYILDLQPESSFVRFVCEQGHTVFLVSWRNPGADLGGTRWDDYLEQGVFKAIDAALEISAADKVNVLGWCVGGTILASAVAVLRERGDSSVASLTLLTTMLDFADSGDLGVYVDEESVAQRERTIGRGGIYPGAELGFAFQTLRANELIWPYVVGNYLKGRSPEAFDLLFWNADSTNLPGPMYCDYLRNMYLENRLCEPGRLTMCGTPVDLRRIDMPCYVLATQEDHIVPWQSAWRTTRLVTGRTQFVLGASGHIAGVINPAAKNRRSYWTDGSNGGNAQSWLDGARSVPGSWWTHWARWLASRAGKRVPARQRLGSPRHEPIEPAPGRYVKERAA